MFAQITKVDEAKRLVYTRVVDETPDRADERFDYAKSKPYFEAWSKNQFDASGGKSYGNVRAMHGKVAAGVISEPLSFSDTHGTIDAAFKIVDDQEWAKVLAGVYTGASIGGSYVGGKVDERIGDRTVKRYVANPVEVSLVDSPCVPTAKFFDIVKADGVTEKRAFKLADTEYKIEGTEAQIEQFAKDLHNSGLTMADVLKMIADAAPLAKAAAGLLVTVEDIEKEADVAKREFSADERKKDAKEGSALPDGSFPIKTVADLKNAVQAYGRAKDKAAAKAHIIARAKALGATAELPDDWKAGEKATESDVEKAVRETLEAVALQKRLADPELPVAEFVEIAKEHGIDVKTLKRGDIEAITKQILEKGKMSAANMDRLQAAHDHLASMGAECGDADKSSKGDLSKGDAATLKKSLEDAEARIKKLESQPVPYVTLRAVARQAEPATKAATAFADTPEHPPLEKADYVYNGDGSVDWATSYTQKRYKLAAAAA
jgi:hypothetical protein